MTGSDVRWAVEDFLTAALFYRRFSEVADRGVDVDYGFQPNLGGFTWMEPYAKEGRVEDLAHNMLWLVKQPDAFERLTSDQLREIVQLQKELRMAAAGMKEWEGYDPPGALDDFDHVRNEWGLGSAGTGYSKEAARAASKVSGICKRIAAILRQGWPDLEGEEPSYRD